MSSFSEPRTFRRDDLYWTGSIVVSFTIAADGSIKDAQARVNEEVPARFYRFGYAIQPIENALPAARQRAEERAKQGALQTVITARYPSRAAACRGELNRRGNH
ncbi:hypothetical protein [Peristeroidobacter agariperforans]|uniref:hypothetical protein n=1 Tax=Peristeroidobacter agariperforans TaxID=268404 RepID=UPI00101D7A83|nr:hypothetical protein [Peristeroidobacter agariperforans]